MKIHDRRSKDVLRNRHVSIIEVDDPYERGEKIVVSRQLRGDPLGRLHAHGQIDQAQYNAGRAFQFDWETAERGARAIDPTKEAVDGGQMPEPITDGQAAARVRSCGDRAGIGASHLPRRPRGCNPRHEHGADCAVRISIAGQAAGQPRSNRAERACDHLRVIQCSAAVFSGSQSGLNHDRGASDAMDIWPFD
jgi:hypothetical protein